MTGMWNSHWNVENCKKPIKTYTVTTWSENEQRLKMKYTSLTKAASPGYTNDDDTHLANQTGDMLTQLVKVQGAQYTIQK